MIYKIYKKRNYLNFEWQTFKKEHLIEELKFEKTKTQFLIKNKTDSRVIYNFNFNEGRDELGTPYTETDLTSFLEQNTGNVSSSSGNVGGIGEASSANQVTGNNVLISINDKLTDKTQVTKITDGTNTMPTGDNASRGIFHILTDGTNAATVKASTQETSRTDKSLVVSLKATQTANIHIVGNIALGGTSQIGIPGNLERKGFEIQNNSNGDLFIGFGITPSAVAGFTLESKGMYSTNAMMSVTAVINISGATTGQQYTYIEY